MLYYLILSILSAYTPEIRYSKPISERSNSDESDHETYFRCSDHIQYVQSKVLASCPCIKNHNTDEYTLPDNSDSDNECNNRSVSQQNSIDSSVSESHRSGSYIHRWWHDIKIRISRCISSDQNTKSSQIELADRR